MEQFLQAKYEGILFVISAPSGTGKTSLIKQLVSKNDNLQISISHTTREKRAVEVDGIDYHFVDKTTFSKMISDNIFLEHAEIYGNFYGTSKKWVEDKLKEGVDIILELDVQGAQNIKKIMPRAINIFILPPSIKELEERLRLRGQDSNDVIEKRLSLAKQEASNIYNYDFLIINEVFEEAFKNLQTLVDASRLNLASQIHKNMDIFKQFI